MWITRFPPNYWWFRRVLHDFFTISYFETLDKGGEGDLTVRDFHYYKTWFFSNTKYVTTPQVSSISANLKFTARERHPRQALSIFNSTVDVLEYLTDNFTFCFLSLEGGGETKTSNRSEDDIQLRPTKDRTNDGFVFLGWSSLLFLLDTK